MRLDYWYEHVEFSLDYSYTPGCPAKIHGPPENCHPEEPAEIEYDLIHFKSLESIVRLVYPPKLMEKFLQPRGETYQQFLEREVEKLNDQIIEKIIEEEEEL